MEHIPGKKKRTTSGACPDHIECKIKLEAQSWDNNVVDTSFYPNRARLVSVMGYVFPHVCSLVFCWGRQ